MATIGQGLITDAETGYLTEQDPSFLSFTAKRKVQFLEVASKLWPRLGDICRVVGITRHTFRNHFNADERFRQDIEELRETTCDAMEAAMVESGIKPMGFLDRMAYLRAHRPHLYNPAQKVIVERQDHISIDVANERVNRLRTVIDADIVETYDKRNLPPATPS